MHALPRLSKCCISITACNSQGHDDADDDGETMVNRRRAASEDGQERGKGASQ